eukprot:jgi/Tetstr1/435533/TSEL_024437.t1
MASGLPADSSDSDMSLSDGPFTPDCRLSIKGGLSWDSGDSLSSEDGEDSELAEALASLGQIAGKRKDLLQGLTASARLPPMAVAILVVGTHGDVAPFCALGKELKAQGHRVRLATHTQYRKLVVEESGLEFYPLKGDPGQLSEFMVKTGGKLIPDSKAAIDDLPSKLEMMRDIIFSTYPAVTMPDPDAGGEGVPGAPFTANAIISNPPVYGHNHVAEALGVPLHLMFPQPWVPTYAFPHPLACIDKQRKGFSYKRQWSRKNRDSYYLVQKLEWVGMGAIMNSFRFAIGLDIKPAQDMDQLYQAVFEKVPFVHMWSPTFVPKPPDWGPLVDVVGNFFTNKLEDAQWTPPDDLAKWLAAGSKPILITFGSMKFDAETLTGKIYKAAKQSGARVLLQSGWSELGIKGEDPRDHGCFIMGRAPHDWLMQRCSGVVHHGGAGTTAAGLRCGLPTFICPFFGDQHFWGEMVGRAHLGPKPCPVHDLTASKGAKILADAFTTMQDPETQKRAQEMAAAFAKEDGVKAGAEAFNRHLPAGDIACASCLNLVAAGLLDKPRRSDLKVAEHEAAMCTECYTVLREELPGQYSGDITLQEYMKWTNDGPEIEDDDDVIKLFMVQKNEVDASREESKTSKSWWNSTGQSLAHQVQKKVNQIVTDSILRPDKEEELIKAGYGPERETIVRFRNQMVEIQSVLASRAATVPGVTSAVEDAVRRCSLAKGEDEPCTEIKCVEKYFRYSVKGTLKIYPTKLLFVADAGEKTPTSDGGTTVLLHLRDIYDTWATKGIAANWNGYGVFVQTHKARWSKLGLPIYSYNFSGMSDRQGAVDMHKAIEAVRVAYATCEPAH